MKKKFYKNSDNAIFDGVCAGISDYFECDVTLCRVLTVVLAVCTPLPIILMYFVAALVAPNKD
jgi:phage shock protein C